MQSSSRDAELPLPAASTAPLDLRTGAEGSSHCRPPHATRFAVPAASCADKIERPAEKRLFWQLVTLPEFRCGSSLDYSRRAAAFNQKAADQACAIYKEERPPPHEQDTLRFIDAYRLREFHESVLSASAAVPSDGVSGATTALAPLQSSSPAPPTRGRFEHHPAQLLGAITGGTASEPVMEDSSAAEAVAALQQIGTADHPAAQPGTDAQMQPQEVAHPYSPASMCVSIPSSDAAAAHAAQAASRQAQRQAELMRCIQPASQQSGPQLPADAEMAHGFAPLPLPQSSTALQQPPAPQPQANADPQLQRRRVLLAVVAVLLANFSAMLGYQMTSRRAFGRSPGARAVMANTAAMSGNLPMMAAAAGMLHTPAKNQGGAGVAKKCRLCQQPRRGTHQHGCPSHCKDCRQPHAACSCGA